MYVGFSLDYRIQISLFIGFPCREGCSKTIPCTYFWAQPLFRFIINFELQLNYCDRLSGEFQLYYNSQLIILLTYHKRLLIF